MEMGAKDAFRAFYKAILVMLAALAPIAAANARMTAFLDKEAAITRAALRDMLPAEIVNATPDVHYIGQFNEICSQNIKADVIILGTSHANRAINPYWLEQGGTLKYFNFAMDGACPSYYLDWWKGVFLPSRYKTPELIIYGVDWFMFDSGWLWRRIEQDQKYMRALPERDGGENNSETARNLLSFKSIDSFLSYVFNRVPVIYARDRIFEMFGEPEPIKSDKNLNIEDCPYYNGHLAISGSYDGRRSAAGSVYYESEEKAFRELLDIWKESGIPVLFVMTPEYIGGRAASNFESQSALITSIAEEYGIDFLNYTAERSSGEPVSKFCLSPEYYYDWGHMNWTGSTAFSKVLKNDLAPYIKKLVR